MDNQEPYYTKDEIEWIKNTFKDNTFALKTLRKFFIPTLNNASPIGELHDMWFEDVDLLARMAPQDRELVILSRIKTIKHIESALMRLRIIAETKDDTEEERKRKNAKDSAK